MYLLNTYIESIRKNSQTHINFLLAKDIMMLPHIVVISFYHFILN